jgi:hypothetical protein
VEIKETTGKPIASWDSKSAGIVEIDQVWIAATEQDNF